MKLTRDDILKLAKLSRLKLSDDEIVQYQTEISALLDYVAQLEAVDVSDLKPTYQVTGLTSADDNVLRDDVVEEQVAQVELLKNVPKIENDQIRVQRMIG